MKKQIKLLTVVTSIALLSSCGMGWDNGGREEIKLHCDKNVDVIMELQGEVAEVFCNCMVENVEKEYDNYDDAIGQNQIELMESMAEKCN